MAGNLTAQGETFPISPDLDKVQDLPHKHHILGTPRGPAPAHGASAGAGWWEADKTQETAKASRARTGHTW